MTTSPAAQSSLTASTSNENANVPLSNKGKTLLAIPVLGAASNFAVLGGSTVTSTGLSVVTGDLGVSPGTAITGFGPGVVNGTIHAGDAAAAQAQSDLTTAYNALAGLPCGTSLTGQDLGGKTLAPGVYCFTSSAQLTGTLTLDAQNSSSAVFIFQIGSTLTTATNSSVVMINGGSDCNVFWQIGSSATLGTGTVFAGNIVALASITLTTNVGLSGRALARTAAVTMDANAVSAGNCSGGNGGGDCGSDLTGAGSIKVGAGVGRFGFDVQQKKSGKLKGGLQYENVSSGTTIRMDAISSLVVLGRTATFAGSGSVNHVPGTFSVTVTDEGGSGSNDRFSIAIAGGPTESGLLRSGSIKLAKKHCGDGDGDDGDDDGDHGDGDHDGHGDHGGHGDDDGHGGHGDHDKGDHGKGGDGKGGDGKGH